MTQSSESLPERIENEEQLDELLSKVAHELHADGIETDQRVLMGATAFAINSATESGDIIVMTSHGRSGLRRWLLGSVAEQLVRIADVPVVLVPSM